MTGGRVNENEVAVAVCKVLAAKSDGAGSLVYLRKEIPKILNLSEEDLKRSKTRPNESMWEQQLRNIQSHHAAEGNFICEGYLEHIPSGFRVTKSGMKFA